MKFPHRKWLLAATPLLAVNLLGTSAKADEVIKFGLSLPLSGPGANWGKGAEWLCNRAARDIKAAGGIKVKDKVYNIECVAYDHKYNAAEGTRVAQTLLNRDGVKHMCVLGTAPGLAAQSLTERQGVLLFFQTWGFSTKGPKYPLTFANVNTPFELMPAMVRYVTQAHPQARTMVLLNANDASGRENEQISRPMWEKAGIKILTSDFYERGTTEFQPIAARLASLKPDIVNLSSVPAAEAGQVFKELEVLRFKGVKVSDNGTSAEAFVKTGGASVNGVYMAAGITFDGPSATEEMRKLNAEVLPYLGESLSLTTNGCYDSVYMLKAGAEKAQSLEPKDIAAVLSTVKFKTFYGGEAGFGGKEQYGANVQPLLPVYITQIVDGKLVERARIAPR